MMHIPLDKLSIQGKELKEMSKLKATASSIK